MAMIFLLICGLMLGVQGQSDLCEIDVGDGTCLWTVVHAGQDVDFIEATKLCTDKGSEVGLVKNQNIYDKTMQNLRQKLAKGQEVAFIWTALRADPFTAEVTYPTRNAFVEWDPFGEETRDSRATQVYINAAPDNGLLYQGMWNANPAMFFHGVICQTKTS